MRSCGQAVIQRNTAVTVRLKEPGNLAFARGHAYEGSQLRLAGVCLDCAKKVFAAADEGLCGRTEHIHHEDDKTVSSRSTRCGKAMEESTCIRCSRCVLCCPIGLLSVLIGGY
jgi:Fe-S-cluster-containing hydrogenase component 2